MENKTNNKQIFGTGIFSFKERCQDCNAQTLVDINGFCSDCYIEDLGAEMNAQELLNETETELFTMEERTDLNIKRVVGK